MKTYNLFYNGIQINKKPLTSEESDNEISLIIINYGYKPEKKENI